MPRLGPPGAGEPYTPLPRGLLVLVGGIALLEAVLSLADAGILADPSLRGNAYRYGAFWVALLHGHTPLYAGQPVAMFLTHSVLHGNFLHMVMNMTILLALGRFVGDRYGPAAIWQLFLAGAVGGGAAFGLLSTTPFPMVGASGAVFGLAGAWTWLQGVERREAGAGRLAAGLEIAGITLVLLLGVLVLTGVQPDRRDSDSSAKP